MRKIFTLLAFFATTTVSAQLQKGDWNINTSTNAPMNFRFRTSGPDYRSYNFSLNPNFGYFPADRWEVGGGPVFSLSGSRFRTEPGPWNFKSRVSAVGLNLYTRYYLKKEGKVIPYVTLNAMYSRNAVFQTDNLGNKHRYHSNSWQIGGGAGASWFITPKVALFGELNYTGNWGDGSGYNSGAEFKVGFQFFLNRKKAK